MSNPVTKLPNGDNQADPNATRSLGNGGASRQIKVSAEQGKEIFGQINVNLKLNSHAHLHQKSAPNETKSGVEEPNQPAVRREKSSTPRSEKTNGAHERASELPEQPHSETSKNNSRILAQTNKQQSAKLIEQQSPIQTSGEDQKPRLPGTEKFARLQPNTNRFAYKAQNQLTPSIRHFNLTVSNHSALNNYSINNHPATIRNHSAKAPNVNSNSSKTPLNNLTNEAIRQIFRDNDVYLSRQAIGNLIERYDENNSSSRNNRSLDSLSKEIFQLVETIENQLLETFLSPRFAGHSASNQIRLEIPQNLDEQVRAAANLLTEIFRAEPVGLFSRFDTGQRMLAAVEVFLRDLPAGISENLQTHLPKNVLDGFLLTRGLLDSGNDYTTKNLLAMMRTATTTNDKVSLTAMRDLGGLVKVLISDAAAAKSIVGLETAVGKFARILIHANRLDAVLAAIRLANQSQFTGGRNSALAPVDELINRLIAAGDRALNEAATRVSEKNAAAIELNKSARSVFPAGTIAELTDLDWLNKDIGESKTVSADVVLRQFLEFNPLLAHDRSLSAFENSDLARQAQNEFLDRHQIEIEQWLRSGNHRLVTDIDFEKPLGIVVERGEGNFLQATTARIVLVRDGSAQGWHFLKSFLIA